MQLTWMRTAFIKIVFKNFFFTTKTNLKNFYLRLFCVFLNNSQAKFQFLRSSTVLPTLVHPYTITWQLILKVRTLKFLKALFLRQRCCSKQIEQNSFWYATHKTALHFSISLVSNTSLQSLQNYWNQKSQICN